jgi:hypothetical protein
MRYALTFLLMATVALGQGVWPKTSTVVDGGHRYDFDTLGKRSVTPSADYGNIVLWQAFSYSDNSDADFYDLSTSGNDGAQGTAASQPTWSSADGGVYDFDGIDDYISVGSVALTTFTMSAWVKPDADAAGMPFAAYSATAANGSYAFRLVGGALRWVKASGASDYKIWVTAAGVLSTNTWTHIAVTQSGILTPTIYINGVTAATTPTTAGTLVEPSSQPFSIGRQGGNSALYFNGIIDDVRRYTSILSSNEVFTIYSNTTH